MNQSIMFWGFRGKGGRVGDRKEWRIQYGYKWAYHPGRGVGYASERKIVAEVGQGRLIYMGYTYGIHLS